MSLPNGRLAAAAAYSGGAQAGGGLEVVAAT